MKSVLRSIKKSNKVKSVTLYIPVEDCFDAAEVRRTLNVDAAYAALYEIKEACDERTRLIEDANLYSHIESELRFCSTIRDLVDHYVDIGRDYL